MEIQPFPGGSAAIEATACLMASAFSEDALYRHFVPDPQRRVRFLQAFMAFRLRYGLHDGKVLLCGTEGVSIWLSPGHTMTPLDLLRFGGLGAMLRCSGAERDRILSFNQFANEALARAAPQPHCLLSPLCVSLSERGKGLGTALVGHGLDALSSMRLPCALETQSEKNVGVYERLGFRILDASEIPGTALRHFVMLYEY